MIVLICPECRDVVDLPHQFDVVDHRECDECRKLRLCTEHAAAIIRTVKAQAPPSKAPFITRVGDGLDHVRPPEPDLPWSEG